MMELKERQCVPINKGTKALEESEINSLKNQLITKWQIIEEIKLKKVFKFENFKRAMAFVQEIGMLAEKENHHPDICIHYTSVEIILTTHDFGGLTVNDFILAAKIEDL